jgi:hypothetical protein
MGKMLKHWVGVNTGQVVSHLDKKTGDIWIGFQCDHCGKVSGSHIANKAIQENSDEL